MKTIVAETSANNQIKIRYVSRPNCLKGKSGRDSSVDVENAHINACVQKVEWIDKILAHGCKEYEHENPGCMDADGDNQTGTLFPVFSDSRTVKRTIPTYGRSCSLAGVIEYYDSDAGRVVRSSYDELSRQKVYLLDIIKKSQHTPKKHCNWGKPQKKKKFTVGAKQRIYEAGAICERDVPLEDSFVLTTTIPGSGHQVYRVVSEWSGWIINRQTQLIRRLEKKGYSVYWFFVWEHQKRGALHQHWYIGIPGYPDLAAWLCARIRRMWFDLLKELSEKTRIDLFQKRGSFGTWLNSPNKWQSDISPVRKSVAGYFSKYCSKNTETSKYNAKRQKAKDRYKSREDGKANQSGVISLCPSRYWGSCSRIKRCAAKLRVSCAFNVANESEGRFILENIRKWLVEHYCVVCEVWRDFKKVAPDTSFVYAKGWEARIWIEKGLIEELVRDMERLRAHPDRRIDAIAAILSLKEF